MTLLAFVLFLAAAWLAVFAVWALCRAIATERAAAQMRADALEDLKAAHSALAAATAALDDARALTKEHL